MIGEITEITEGGFFVQGDGGFNVGDIVEIKKKRKVRNLDQNALYWLFCEFVGAELAMEKEEIHSGFSGRFLQKKTYVNGKPFYAIRSTGDLTTEEFALYFDKCNIEALDYGVDTSPFWLQYEHIIGSRSQFFGFI